MDALKTGSKLHSLRLWRILFGLSIATDKTWAIDNKEHDLRMVFLFGIYRTYRHIDDKVIAANSLIIGPINVFFAWV